MLSVLSVSCMLPRMGPGKEGGGGNVLSLSCQVSCTRMLCGQWKNTWASASTYLINTPAARHTKGFSSDSTQVASPLVDVGGQGGLVVVGSGSGWSGVEESENQQGHMMLVTSIFG